MPARSDLEPIVCGGLRPRPPAIHRVLLPQHDIVVDAILDIWSPIGDAEESLRVGFVLREQERYLSIAIEVIPAQLGMFRGDGRGGRSSLQAAKRRLFGFPRPRPGVAKPERRQDVKAGRIRAAVVDADLDQEIRGDALAYSTKTSK